MQDHMASCVLWYNDIFKINNKTMFLKGWSENNINFLNSLLDEDGKIMEYNNFTSIYKNVKTNFLEF